MWDATKSVWCAWCTSMVHRYTQIGAWTLVVPFSAFISTIVLTATLYKTIGLLPQLALST